MTNQADEDNMWYCLGKQAKQFSSGQAHLICFLSNKFRDSHPLSKAAELEFHDLKSAIDNICCGAYPFHVTNLPTKKKITIVSIFYGVPKKEKYLFPYDKSIGYPKCLTTDELNLIHQFINDLEEYINSLHEHLTLKHFPDLKKRINITNKKINKFKSQLVKINIRNN